MSITTSTRRMTAKEQMIFELGKRQGLKWGANYMHTLVINNTIISELYGWKPIIDDALEKTLALIEKIPDGE